ncbi:MAG: hypothetical protein KDC52_06380, partial [Ignavibacteriae bacterium]|nr:hypothetical protein [Ignavibacteriota bacterium]
MKIINLIDNYNIINKGIWGSVLVLEEELTPLGIICEYWGPKILSLPEEFKNKEVLFFTRNLLKDLKKISENDISTTLIHSHSSWGYNNILAYFLSRKGYKWVFSPHGTLEPWALVQKQLKKKIYLNLIGNKIFSKANYIRAVS